jgi:hypothetical protein
LNRVVRTLRIEARAKDRDRQHREGQDPDFEVPFHRACPPILGYFGLFWAANSTAL